MFDKKKCKSKTVVDYALSPEGQKIVGGGIFRWTNRLSFNNKERLL
jgi:hypothetical protein